MRLMERIPAVNSFFSGSLPFFGSLGAISRQKGLFVIPNKRTYSLFQTGGLIRYSKQEGLFVIP